MPDTIRDVFADRPETVLYRDKGNKRKKWSSVLLGSWLGVIEEPGDGWLKVTHYDEEAWVREEETRADSGMKVFFVDVGQGDAAIVEAPGKRLLVDGGPNNLLGKYLTGWKYDWMKNEEDRIRFDAVFVSHFDYDHFNGLTSVINDDSYEFGTI